MKKLVMAVPFAVGVAILAWTAYGFIASPLPLLMTAVIAAAYLLGAFELRQFRATTAQLRAALDDLAQPPASLADWLQRVPASLRDAVRLRVEGERGSLPGPALTPYLVGLLVMLGMLGTFLGMVVTFQGAVFALQGSTDLQALRGALAEPIKGLGLAFGTSVAGVATSAMLGLMSALARRERLDVARLLEARIGGVLQPFSLAHQRNEAFRAVQAQAHALPDVVTALQALVQRIEQRSDALEQQVLARQQEFHREATEAYTALAQDVGASLKDSLAAGSRAAGETITPVVQHAMAQFVEETRRMHEGLATTAQSRVDALLASVDASLERTGAQRARADEERLAAWTQSLQGMASELQDGWRRAGDAGIAQQQAACAALAQAADRIAETAGTQAGRALERVAVLLDQSEALVQARTEGEERMLAQQGERMDQVAQLWRTELATLRREEGERGAAAVARLGELQAAVAQHLATLGAALEAPLTRLLQTAAEVPQAAAGVITQLRAEMGRLSERDNLALEERTTLLERLNALLASVNTATGEQRAAIETMVDSASSVMQQAVARFGEALQQQAGEAAEVAAHVQAGAVEVASLAEAFGESMRLFQAGNDKLTETLQRVESALTRSTTRSDEQLAYYVAQAREVIDLSIASQQGLVEHLRQLQQRAPAPAPTAAPAPAAAAEEARA